MPFLGVGIIYYYWKYVVIFEKSSLKTFGQKSMIPGIGCGHNEGLNFYIRINSEKIFKNILKYNLARKVETCGEHLRAVSVGLSLLNRDPRVYSWVKMGGG